MQQWLLLQPVKKVVAIGGRQYFVKRICLGPFDLLAQAYCKQMQIMIAKGSDSGMFQRFDQPQDFQRLWATVDQITRQPDLILCRIELDALEQ